MRYTSNDTLCTLAQEINWQPNQLQFARSKGSPRQSRAHTHTTHTGVLFDVADKSHCLLFYRLTATPARLPSGTVSELLLVDDAHRQPCHDVRMPLMSIT